MLPRRVRVVINYLLLCLCVLIVGLIHFAYVLAAAAQLEAGIWGEMVLFYGGTLVMWLVLLWLPIISMSHHKIWMRLKAKQGEAGL